jgi:hypothetical protein
VCNLRFLRRNGSHAYYIQTWAIGISIFLIRNQISRDASYLISIALIFVFSTAFVILVIWPKTIFDAWHKSLGNSSEASPRSFGWDVDPFYSQSASLANFDDDKMKISRLEAENEALRVTLLQKGGEVKRPGEGADATPWEHGR